jgi:hypothetical protein
MSYPVFYPIENTTLYVPFSTYDGGTGASLTMTGLAVTDIEIYKDGSVTQRASDAGYALLDTDGIDFDGITGIHGFSIDLSDNTTAGFYAAGSTYWIVVSSVTVDAQTVNFIAGWFQIKSATRGFAGTALPAAAADAAGGLPISDAGGLDLDAKLANTNEVTAARMGALTDWINGGRLDLLLDAVLADTGELQTDWVNGGRLDLLIDAILADTNELQTDWVNGGRLDLILDIVAADTTTDIPALIATLQAFVDTEISDILTDTGTTLDDLVDDLEGRLTAALATQLAAHSLGVGRGVVDAGSSTTALIMKSVNGAAADATDDHYNGRHVVFTSGALLLQAASITDYVGATKTATISAVTDTPAEDVTFVIV